jgi:hypothetical protein
MSIIGCMDISISIYVSSNFIISIDMKFEEH